MLYFRANLTHTVHDRKKLHVPIQLPYGRVSSKEQSKERSLQRREEANQSIH